MHALDAAVLFSAAGEDEVIEYDGDEGDEWDVDGWDSRGGSPVDEGDQDISAVSYLLFKGINLLIQPQWEATPPPFHAPTKQREPAGTTFLSLVPSQFATSPPPPSPPPSTQAHHPAPFHPIKKEMWQPRANVESQS